MTRVITFLLGISLPGLCLANVGAELTLTSDYIFRGISLSDNGPALQGSVYMQSEETGLYGGIFASLMDYATVESDAFAQIDLYAGMQNVVPLDALPLFPQEWAGDWLAWNAELRYYAFPGADENAGFDKPDFFEASVGLSGHFHYFSAWNRLAWSPNLYGNHDRGLYYATGVTVPLPYDFTWGAHMGYQWVEENRGGVHDTLDWSLSLTKAVPAHIARNVTVTSAFTDSDPRDAGCYFGSELCDARLLISITKRW